MCNILICETLIKYWTGGVPVCGPTQHGGGGEGADEQGLECGEGEEAGQQ